MSEESLGQDGTYLINSNPKENSYYEIPFIPGFNNSQYIDTMTISPNATRKGPS